MTNHDHAAIAIDTAIAIDAAMVFGSLAAEFVIQAETYPVFTAWLRSEKADTAGGNLPEVLSLPAGRKLARLLTALAIVPR